MKKKKMLKKTKAKDLVKLNELTILFEEFNRIYNDNFFLNNYTQTQQQQKTNSNGKIL
jgi:hypothetical protein